jgi:uracil phosphoribosyltransferase
MSSFTSTDKAIVLQCRCLNHLFTKIRDERTTRKDFVTYSRRLMRVICEEGIACLEPGVYQHDNKYCNCGSCCKSCQLIMYLCTLSTWRLVLSSLLCPSFLLLAAKTITTPTGSEYQGAEIDTSNIVAVSIIRAGDSMLDSFLEVCPEAKVGKILIQR